MDTLSDQIVSGIVSGLVTSIIILIFVKNWTHIILPWFEKLLYTGVKIDGKWSIHTDAYSDQAEIIISQSANRITGDISWQATGGRVEYTCIGEFSDLILTATYKQRDPNSLDRGTVTLLCLENGQLLSGCYAWYDISASKIVSGIYECRRKK